MKSLNTFAIISLFLALLFSCSENKDTKPETTKAQKSEQYEIPNILHNIYYNENGKLEIKDNGKIFKLVENETLADINNFLDCAKGTATGIAFDFNNPKINGTLYCGFILAEEMKYPQPVYFKRSVEIKAGKAEFDIKNTLQGKYDIAEWEEKGYAHLGFRVIMDDGTFLHDGKLLFEIKKSGAFEVVLSIIEGPFINMLTPNSAVISFRTNKPDICSVKINGTEFKDVNSTVNHEIPLIGLSPNTEYNYEIIYGKHSFKSKFRTAPENGSRKPFTFAFASDSRMGPGMGERAIYGVNSYIMKKIAALASQRGVAFWQFTGDMVAGYLSNEDEIRLQYMNWKRAIDAFSSSYPVYVGQGNHEAVTYEFIDESGEIDLAVDKFPYNKYSAETIFGGEYVNFTNGPQSEDGSKYDPDPNAINFPSYQENVFYYTYDNVAMIVLNSNYLYSPSRTEIPIMGGNLHGYLMDNQIAWLKETLKKIDADPNIDHIFVSQHTPAFPNGGHSKDDMWYSGENSFRPYIAGKPVEKGIIERRDEYLAALLSSPKVVAILTGDEHNYSRLRLDKNTQIYPANWEYEKVYIDRPIWHICNGSAGAPYYGQEVLPWSPSVEKFSTQYALCFFEINGKNVNITVQDPDTYEIIESVKLK